MASTVICLIVAVSFVIFAVDQTSTAAAHQREQVAPAPATSAVTPPGHHHSAVRKTIDDASATLTSPFSGIVAASSGEWAVRLVKLGLSLLVYGFGLGYLARALRVRV